MAGKKTVGQKKRAREVEQANAPTERTGSRFGDKMAEVKKKLGNDGRICLVSDMPGLASFPRRSSGVLSLDWLLGGGLPMGGMVEFGGPASVGKSLLALHAVKHSQRTDTRPILWVAMEPFSRRWARTVGIWIPFSEELIVNPETGNVEPMDSYSAATEVELARISQLMVFLGVEEWDPYGWNGLAEIWVMSGEFGDAILQAGLNVVRTNEFALMVVDSLAMMKSEDWVSAAGIQDASDFDRSIKIIGNYTARCQLAFNVWYDENNVEAPGGRNMNQTTVINIQQITTRMNNQSYSPWAEFEIKGGQASKHNHLSICAFLQGELIFDKPTGDKTRVGHYIKMKNLKSKIGNPYQDSQVAFYTQAHGDFLPGDIDVAKDVCNLAAMTGVVTKSGAWFSCEGVQMGQGIEQATQFLRENPAWLQYAHETTLAKLRA